MGAICVQNLGKRFARPDPHRVWTLQETVMRPWVGRRRAEPFWALRGISFRVEPGRMVGVVGRNGAGKSTLLRLVGGIGRPDEGKVSVEGRIGGLLELQAGFHSDLTGRENVFVSGVIRGLTRQEVAQRYSSIVAFSELEPFIDSPVRTYSSGMQMRLAFSVAIHAHPEVLLIDEVLAVGDLAFQRKCLDRVAELKSQGCAILLVSHDSSLTRELCDEAIWLREGQLVEHGPARDVVERYMAEMSDETLLRTPVHAPVLVTPAGLELRVRDNRFGSLEGEIREVRLLGPGTVASSHFESGQPLSVEIDYFAQRSLTSPIFGVTIVHEDGRVCYNASSEGSGAEVPTIQGRGRVAVSIDRLDLEAGLYFVDVGMYERRWAYAYDYHWLAYPLRVGTPAGDHPGRQGSSAGARWQLRSGSLAGQR